MSLSDMLHQRCVSYDDTALFSMLPNPRQQQSRSDHFNPPTHTTTSFVSSYERQDSPTTFKESLQALNACMVWKPPWSGVSQSEFDVNDNIWTPVGLNLKPSLNKNHSQVKCTFA